MKLSKMAIIAAIACGIHAGSAFGQQANNGIEQVACASCDCGQPVCGCEAPAATCDDNACGSGSCDNGCGAAACDSDCNSCGCGLGSCLSGFGCCELGDPWTLFKCQPMGFTVGGWSDIGYHSDNNAGGGINSTGGLNGATGAPANFNNYDNRVQLQQQWFFAEKIADGSCGLGLGGRVDYLYGTDAPDTQAFGRADSHWDNPWDNGGAYGHAIPQLYTEVAYGDTSVKVGKFFTIIGNEVVAATGNFFYSRQFTFYNAEPFTHTGALATHKVDDCTTLYGGYVLGWDSGFKDNGDAFLGGIKRQLNDDVSVLYTTAVGRFGDRPNGAGGVVPTATGARERGSIHSFILTMALTDKLTHLIQYDYLDTQDDTSSVVRRTNGYNSYFIYQVNDCLSLGSRSEYFNWETNVVDNSDSFNQTVGVNYNVNANLRVRPEMRWIWDPQRTGINENFRYNQPIFGMDAIYTF